MKSQYKGSPSLGGGEDAQSSAQIAHDDEPVDARLGQTKTESDIDEATESELERQRRIAFETWLGTTRDMQQCSTDGV